MALLDDIRFQFKTGNILMQLIYINGGIFLAMMIVRLLFFLTGNGAMFETFIYYLSIPSSPQLLLFRPWTIITHLFIHAGFIHILFNMVWLYFGGTIFMNFLDSRKLLSTYILGGISGAFFFILAFNIFPAFSNSSATAQGASAAVLAIMVAAATTAPNYVVRLVLIGPVKLKYVAIVSILLDVLFIPDGNAGGHIAHLGGALFGFIYATQLERGKDISVNFMGFIYWIKGFFYSRKSPIKVVHRKSKTDHQYNEDRAFKQEEMDAILDKIKCSGYESLSKKEKEVLFRASKEI